MTDHDKRLVLRGVSIARGILINESCDHMESLITYQKLRAGAWQIDDGSALAPRRVRGTCRAGR